MTNSAVLLMNRFVYCHLFLSFNSPNKSSYKPTINSSPLVNNYFQVNHIYQYTFPTCPIHCGFNIVIRKHEIQHILCSAGQSSFTLTDGPAINNLIIGGWHGESSSHLGASHPQLTRPDTGYLNRLPVISVQPMKICLFHSLGPQFRHQFRMF